ncbi:MAG: hypothetical protein R6V67_03625 [Spirochaetia bacterium]
MLRNKQHHTPMEEHKLILGFLDRLAQLMSKLETSSSFSDFRTPIPRVPIFYS